MTPFEAGIVVAIVAVVIFLATAVYEKGFQPNEKPTYKKPEHDWVTSRKGQALTELEMEDFQTSTCPDCLSGPLRSRLVFESRVGYVGFVPNVHTQPLHSCVYMCVQCGSMFADHFKNKITRVTDSCPNHGTHEDVQPWVH